MGVSRRRRAREPRHGLLLQQAGKGDVLFKRFSLMMAAPPLWAAGEDDKMTLDGVEGKGDVSDTWGDGLSAKFADSLDRREGGESDSGWSAQGPELEHAGILLEPGPVGESGARIGAGERLGTTGYEARCPLAQDGDAVRCGTLE